MKQKFDKFLKTAWGLEVWTTKKMVFRSKKSGVRGLLDFINKHGRRHEGLIIFDKIVGQGVAFLAAYLKAKEVYGGAGSRLAAKALKKYKIRFYFQNTVPNILNRDKTDLCPLERLSVDKTPEEFYYCLSRK